MLLTVRFFRKLLQVRCAATVHHPDIASFPESRLFRTSLAILVSGGASEFQILRPKMKYFSPTQMGYLSR